MTFIKSLVGLYLLAVISIGLYMFRFELGLAKPSFVAGDCIAWDYGDEFTTRTWVSYVIKVGKQNYLVAPIYNGIVRTSWPESKSFSSIERNHYKTECNYRAMESTNER